MPIAQKKSADLLADAQEIIRKKNKELTDQQKLIRQLRNDNDTAETIRSTIFHLAERSPAPPPWVNGRGGHSGARGAPSMIWSDWHYGERVNPDELGGLNEFNAEIAKDRAFKLVNIGTDLAFNHMGRAKGEYPGIVICLGGDMVGGAIHEELLATNDRTTIQAVNEVTDILTACIDNIATKFSRVFLPCVVGNHGRSTMKPRKKQYVYTNFDWLIYCNLERHFRKDTRIQFFIPNETDAYFKVYGHRFHLTHGDNLGVRGGDGIIGSIGPIKRGAMKVGRSQAHIRRDYDTLLMGHWHTYMNLMSIIVNGTLKGFDEFAHIGLRVPYEQPTQALWFTHPEHGITASWPVYLDKKRTATDNKNWVKWQVGNDT